mmetsp:Transcript_12088/g.17723  ORF Transcript_12088/g.17723 Transcript_12088/m.17723 type:complete len:263 (+) Transcript_12088:1018-1806(+)
MLSLADHILHLSVSQLGHSFPNFLSHQKEIVHDMLWLSRKFAPELFILRSDTYGACIQVALTHHDTSHSNQRSGSKAKLLGSKQTRYGNITTSFDLPISLQLDAITETIQYQCLLCFSKTELPRQATSLDSRPSRSPRSTVVSTDGNVIRERLRYARSDDTNSNFGHKLDRNFSCWLSVLQVMNQLSKIFNRVNVVMRGWRDEPNSWRGVSIVGNVFRNLETGKFSSFSGLGTLCHLDLNLVTVGKVMRRNTKSSRRHLFDT